MKLTKTFFSILALLFTFCVNTNAANEYVFQEGTNQVEPYKGFTGTYTVKTNGMVEVATTEGMDKVECAGVSYTYSWVPAATFPYTYNIDAKAGDVITIYRVFNMCTQVRITENANNKVPVEFVTCSPAQNKMFSWSTAGHVSLLFSKPITINNVVLKAKGQSYPVSDLNCSNGNVGFNITYALNEAYSNGLQDNEEFSIELTGIADANDPDNKYKETGTLVLKYYAPSTQHNLTKTTMNGKQFNDGIVSALKFVSYYSANGEDGVITLEFDDNITSVGDCYLSMGNIDQDPVGKYFRETLRPVVNGNKITLDFRNKLRTLARMFPAINIGEIDPNDHIGAFDHEHISLRVGNVKDSKGNPFYTSVQGNVGSYVYVFNYEEIVDEIVMDGNREGIDSEGCNKSNGSEVQLWIDQEVKSIDGVRVYIQVDNGNVDEETQETIYATGEVSINKSSIKIVSHDPYDGTVISFTMPELKAMVMEGGEVEDPQEKEYTAAEGTKIRLVLQVTTTNGMPHDLVINYVYSSTLGITNIENTPNTANTIYNLNGQQVSADSKGLIILGGKKIIR